MSKNPDNSVELTPEGKSLMENVRQHTLRIMIEENAGPSISKLLRRLDEATDATVIRVFHNMGELLYSDPQVDHGVRLRAVQLGLELWGAMPDKRLNVNVREMAILDPDLSIQKKQVQGLEHHGTISG